MWTRLIFISMVLALSSCNKDESTFQKEDSLLSDTATLVISAEYVSHTASNLNIEMEILVLNGLESKQDYSDVTITLQGGNPDISLDYSSNYAELLVPNSSYSNVFLIDESDLRFFNDNIVGFYLKRYFEQIENNSSKNYGFAGFNESRNKDLEIYKQNPLLFSGNSVEFTMNKFYELTASQGNFEEQYNTQMTFLSLQLNDLIDDMASATDLPGAKSITFITGSNLYTGFDVATDLDITIAKANAEGISINLMGNNFPEDVKRLAYDTGGFVSELLYNEGQNPAPDNNNNNDNGNGKEFSSIGVYLQNIDNLLSHNINVHHIDFSFSSGSYVFSSGSSYEVRFNYNYETISYELNIP